MQRVWFAAFCNARCGSVGGLRGAVTDTRSDRSRIQGCRGATLIQLHVLPVNLNRVPGRTTEIKLVVMILKGDIASGSEPDQASIDVGSAERVIDDIVIGRIFISAAAIWAVNIRIVLKSEDFCGGHCTDIDVVLTDGAVIAVISRRLLIQAVGSVVEEQ